MTNIYVLSFAAIMSLISFLVGVFVGFKRGYFFGLKDGTIAGIMARVIRVEKEAQHEKG